MAGANEKAVGARRSCLLAPHPLDLVVAADGKTKSEISGLDKAVAEALELHPCLRPAAVPRLWLAKGLHQLGRLLLFQEALILAGAPGAKVAGRMRFTSKPQQGWGEVDSLHVYSSRPMPGLSPALAPVCSVWGASEEGPVSWKFSNVQIESEKRTLLEVYGYAEAALSRCTLTGSNVDGEVNRCTDAILIRSLQRSRPVPQLPDAHRSGPRVTVHSSALRHSDQALRILVPAGGLNSTAHLTNCLVENNTKGFVMACSSQVILKHCTLRHNRLGIYSVEPASGEDIAVGCLVLHESCAIRGATFADFRRPESWTVDGVTHSGDDATGTAPRGFHGAMHPAEKYHSLFHYPPA